MNKYLNGILVVEGKSDMAFLSNFLYTNFVLTNGFDIENEISFLQIAEKRNIPIYVLTDSDDAGKKIRNSINEKLDNVTHLNVDITQCDKKGKHGVAECKIEEIMRVLEPFLNENIDFCPNITSKDILLLEEKEEKISSIRKQFHIPMCNNKSLVKRLNMLRVKKEEIGL